METEPHPPATSSSNSNKDPETPQDATPPKKRESKLTKGWKILLTILAVLGVGVVSLYSSGADWLQSRRKYRILVPLYASSQEYLDYMGIKDGHYPKGNIKRKVSVDTIFALEAAKDAWFEVERNKNLKSITPDNVNFYYFPEGYDETSYEAAFNKAMETAKNDEVEVVGVIGHVTSTVTHAYGRFYGRERLPLVLPLSTATDLTNYLRGTCKVPAVLRLPPSNDKQAELISKFLSDQQALRVILVKDLSNPEYSDDLIEGFRNHFVSEPFESQRKIAKSERRPMYLVDHGQILAVLPTGGSTGMPIMYPGLKELNADALVLASMTAASYEALAQARTEGVAAKFTILTDGAIDEDLLPRVNRLISNDELQSEVKARMKTVLWQPPKVPIEGKIYITFPLDEPLPKVLYEEVLKNFHRLDGELGERNLEMTHTQYAVDAAQILLSTLKTEVAEAGYSWLQEPRDAISAKINKWNDAKITEKLVFSYDENRRYNLDGAGNTLQIPYHLYTATLPGLTAENKDAFFDAKANNQAKEKLKEYWAGVKWVHDPSCPH